MTCCIIVPFFSFLLLASAADGQLVETERVAEYNARKHTWPPQENEYIPDTAGWRAFKALRFRQIERIENLGDKYNGYMSAVYSALVAPNFTENGWGLTRAPQGLVDKYVENLDKLVAKGIENLPTETMTECIEGKDRPVFVDQGRLNSRALRELKPILEAWSGVKLVENNAYGLRIYRNESNLHMHVDKSETHVISCILHIGHDADSDPWPIVIEDFQGKTNEVILESGDMLLYESSKCIHGRPQHFRGSWYTSVFVHYYPLNWPGAQFNMDTHYRIPPSWTETKPPEEGLEELVVIETAVKEPNCKDDWCDLENSLKWSGPAEYGKSLSAGGVVTNLQIPPDVETGNGGKDEL